MLVQSPLQPFALAPIRVLFFGFRGFLLGMASYGASGSAAAGSAGMEHDPVRL